MNSPLSRRESYQPRNGDGYADTSLYLLHAQNDFR
jgi:hypothetical protein